MDEIAGRARNDQTKNLNIMKVINRNLLISDGIAGRTRNDREQNLNIIFNKRLIGIDTVPIDYTVSFNKLFKIHLTSICFLVLDIVNGL